MQLYNQIQFFWGLQPSFTDYVLREALPAVHDSRHILEAETATRGKTSSFGVDMDEQIYHTF